MDKIKKIFVTTFFIIVSIFMIITLLNNNEISNVERRKLSTYPKFEIKKLLSKDYYNDLTSAFQDQLAFRSSLVKGYFLFNFQRYFGDVAKGSNNQLYAASEAVPSNNYYNELKNITNEINKTAKSTPAKFIFLSIPRKDAYMTKDLPKNYQSSIEIYKKAVETVKKNLSSEIIFIDALEIFNKSNIYECYYSNDHHTTPKCSYLLYKEINKYTKTNSYDLNETFDIKKTIVNGAYNRQLGQTVKSSPEDLYIVPKIKINYTRYENGKISAKKVYGSGTSYEDAYMEGDMAYTLIRTNSKNNKKIMFVGSSYTNILEALSVPSYKQVSSLDYRHNKTGNSISYYVKKDNVDYIVYIPGQSTTSFSLNQMKLHLGK